MSDISEAVVALTQATSLLVTTRNELLDWSTGSATGGPRGDGTYPFTQANGSQVFVASPARITANNPNRILIPAFVSFWAGQSNSVGASTDRSHDYVTDPRTLAYHQVDGLVPYRPNVFAGYSMGNPTGEWAAELRYAQRLRSTNPTATHIVVKYAQGNTFLYQTDGLDWNVNSSDELFSRAAAHFAGAMAAILAAGYDPVLRLVQWQQGENDTANAFIAGQYQANLTALLNGIRSPTIGWKVAPNVPIYIGRLSAAYVGSSATRQTVRDTQDAVIAAAPGGPTVLIDCDGLPMEADVTHYTKTGLYALGDRIAARDGLGTAQQDVPGPITNLVVSETTSTTASLTFTNAARGASYQYLVNGVGNWQALSGGRQLTGLSPQTNYSVQLRAINSSGTGPVAGPVAFTTVISGPQSLLKNGTFTTNANWALRSGFSISNGKLHLTNVAIYEFTEQTGVPLVAGVTYTLTFTISNWAAGQIVFGTDGGTNNTIQIGYGSNGPQTVNFVAKDGNTSFFIKSLGDGSAGVATMDIDDIAIFPAA